MACVSPSSVSGCIRPSKMSRIIAIERVRPHSSCGTGFSQTWSGHVSRRRRSQTSPDSGFQCSFAPPGMAI